ncbi:MAG: polysaccharide deacetylase family protein [Proteobacteria bacterium]|nr:polysaccharide deacetylase family protein [Pseudomonadota bacterium]
MKAVMYHYVRRFKPTLPYFRYLDFENFSKQLDFFQNEYNFISLDEYERVINQKLEPPKNKIILTFDDGLIDHYEFVYPELKKRGLWGIFYVPTMPLSLRKFLGVHLIHLLTGSIAADVLIKQLDSIIKEEMIPDIKIKEFRDETYTNQINPPTIDRFKKTLNYFIDYKYQAEILDQFIEINHINVYVDDYYLNDEKINVMASNGMVIGSHSVSHPVFSKLTYDEQKSEISSSFHILEQIIGTFKLKSFCFPYGGFHTFNNDTINILEEQNCSFSFNVESRDITQQDVNHKRQSLPRYDCNEFPYGAVELSPETGQGNTF